MLFLLWTICLLLLKAACADLKEAFVNLEDVPKKELDWLMNQIPIENVEDLLNSELTKIPTDLILHLRIDDFVREEKLRPAALAELLLTREFDEILLNKVLCALKGQRNDIKIATLDGLKGLSSSTWKIIGAIITSSQCQWWKNWISLVKDLSFNMNMKEERLRLLLELPISTYLPCTMINNNNNNNNNSNNNSNSNNNNNSNHSINNNSNNNGNNNGNKAKFNWRWRKRNSPN